MCFFKVKHSFGHILERVGLINMKQREMHWVNYVISNFDLTHDHDLKFVKVKFQNSFM